jgi:hypothetical protein
MPVSIRGFATLCLLVSAATAAGQHPLPPQLIDFRSDHGEELLVQAESRQAYFRLTSHFVTQENRAFCGVASMTMVLNALQVSAPEVPELAPYNTFTQTNVLDARTEAVVPRATIRNAGLSLDQLAALLATKPVAVSVHHAEDGAIGEFRARAQDHLSRPDHYVIVNYLRTAIGQEGGGHHSPLAAYHRASDRFLVLDVARYKYPPVWVTTDDLFDAMNTRDAGTGDKTRGYLLVSRR